MCKNVICNLSILTTPYDITIRYGRGKYGRGGVLVGMGSIDKSGLSSLDSHFEPEASEMSCSTSYTMSVNSYVSILTCTTRYYYEICGSTRKMVPTGRASSFLVFLEFSKTK